MCNEFKKCTICKQSKQYTLEFFVKSSSSKSGLRNQCKDCKNKKLNKSRKLNPEKRRSLDRTNYNNNKEKFTDRMYSYRLNNPNYEKKRYLHKKDNLTKSYVANLMNLRVSELDNRVYKTQKIIIQLKQEIKKQL